MQLYLPSLTPLLFVYVTSWKRLWWVSRVSGNCLHWGEDSHSRQQGGYFFFFFTRLTAYGLAVSVLRVFVVVTGGEERGRNRLNLALRRNPALVFLSSGIGWGWRVGEGRGLASTCTLTVTGCTGRPWRHAPHVGGCGERRGTAPHLELTTELIFINSAL